MGLITKPYTFSTGELIIAAEHNANYDTLYNLLNGNLDDDNIAAGAAIDGTKIDWSTMGQIGGTSPSTATFTNLTFTGSISNSYAQTFINANLTAHKLRVAHNIGHQYLAVQVFDSNNEVVIPDKIECTSTTHLALDLASYTAIAGTWHIRVVG